MCGKCSRLPEWLLNTVVFAGGVTIISLFLILWQHMQFARMKFTGRKLLFGIILLTMRIPFQVVMIPLYMEEYKLGILNTFFRTDSTTRSECLRYFHADLLLLGHTEIAG